jgi:hypothetical protein
MTSRRATAAVVALVLVAGTSAFACARGDSSESAPRADADVLVAARAANARPTIETLHESGGADTTIADPTRTYEELSEPDPSAGDDPSTTDDGSGDPSSTTSTDPKPAHHVTISTKGEPTGPGVPPIPPYTQTQQEIEYFNCVTQRESGNNPRVINMSSGAAGLFQFLQSTWDLVARRVGRLDLVGVNPALASVATQRWFAHVLFLWQGSAPWVSDGCQVPGVPPSSTTTTGVNPPPTDPPGTDEPTTSSSSTTTTATSATPSATT